MPGVYLPTETTEEAQRLLASIAEAGIKTGQLVSVESPTYLPLPRTAEGYLARSFRTTDHVYHIIPPADGIGFDRWSRMIKLLIPLQFGMRDYDNIRQYWSTMMNDTVAMTDLSAMKVHVVKRVADFLDAAVAQGQQRYDDAAYICTLFIVRDGEDLTNWTHGLAEEKIADWDAHNFDFQDFFFAVAGLSKKYLADYQNRREELERLSGLATNAAT